MHTPNLPRSLFRDGALQDVFLTRWTVLQPLWSCCRRALRVCKDDREVVGDFGHWDGALGTLVLPPVSLACTSLHNCDTRPASGCCKRWSCSCQIGVGVGCSWAVIPVALLLPSPPPHLIPRLGGGPRVSNVRLTSAAHSSMDSSAVLR